MVLYEDLRIYTIWRTEMARANADSSNQNSSPNPNNQAPNTPNLNNAIGSNNNVNQGTLPKSAEEWEILGELAERLHHFPEAVEAYQNCLRVRFSPKAMKAVIKMWEGEKKNELVLQGIIKLIAWQYRWYSEVCTPLFPPDTSSARLINRDVPVLPSPPPHHPKTHRRRRRRQSQKYSSGHELPPAGTRFDSSLCSAL